MKQLDLSIFMLDLMRSGQLWRNKVMEYEITVAVL